MQIRYGFDVALDLAQPATILAMMDVHSDLRRCIGEETELEVAPTIAAERFVDDKRKHRETIVGAGRAGVGVASRRLSLRRTGG
jgi:hypothetical protein